MAGRGRFLLRELLMEKSAELHALAKGSAPERSSTDEPITPHATSFTLDQLYRRFAPDVARLAARMLGPGPDADDVVHDVFLVVHRRQSELLDETHLATWFRRLTVNVVREQRRKRRWKWWLVRTPELPEIAVEEAAPSELLERRQNAERVHAILATLRPEYRDVLVLFELEGVSGEEIAEHLQLKLSTVWVWLHRAREAFAKELGRQEARER